MTLSKFIDFADRFAANDRFQTRFDAARSFYILAVAAFAFFVCCLGLMAFDPRQFGMELTWTKPTKFAVSFVILFLTQAFVATCLSDRWRFNLVLVVMAVASGCAMVFEMGYMMYQANLLESSHWNEATPFHEMMYGLMGAGATTLMVSALAVGAIAVFDKDAKLDPLMKWGIALGFGLSFVLTFWVAGEMAGGGGRYIGVPTDGGARVPLFGWSREVGDLRPSHFLSLHAMQILPVLALTLRGVQSGFPILLSASAGYAILTVLVMFQALAGQPLY
ncbi:hypothetical protein SLH49_21885 [Cognatiyoonia sp. IB215446]|uniref:hypothetical protein n=1 Tax=Cognatiyoonia sp. IB215446 TaxID=3097355 RepID=UPI002A12A43F|nr:hypothetical protein [Cognatiyoonia sp. IB215446]MDX8350649.1 hypothetical protein [Cognatiyoonia sp. IB215446]